MEYSADGSTWTRLGAYGQGTNWYNKNYSGNNLWSVQDYTRWHVATIPLPTGYNHLRLRFVVTSDPFVNREGIAVDDIHIYDNVYGIYDGPPYTTNTINQATVNGNNWIDFTDGGKLDVAASINPNRRPGQYRLQGIYLYRRRGDPRVDQCARQRLVGGDVEIREENRGHHEGAGTRARSAP